MKITAEPRSDQWNYDDFIGGPRTFTIAGVKPGAAEQKYDIELVEGEGRVWRPPLTVLRVLIGAWGNDAADWAGKQVTLYGDPAIRFGKEAVGGIRVSHMSGLPNNKPFEIRVTAARGKRALVRVEPITDTPKPAAKQPPEQVTKAITAFESIGVTVAQLETKLGKTTADWTPEDVQQLGQIFAAINEGHTTTEFEFGGEA